ncbi:uncharacterized protein LOC121640178 [Melanotaenia boesemani]|uniref:uncharacterized protein LOC121640178 n=1 Tax=Melanotaenia boesemani TaxID=1250792 RepID=UPI001C0416C7|nr:uncharacterized protein LOC121640178 [Melanotaenia boesemani]
MMSASAYLVVSAVLTIQPDRSQFHLYESFNVTCVGNNWMVMRQTSDPPEPCDQWGRPNGTSCINRSTYKSDSGSYWCQSENGERSNVLNITVNLGVILEVPALPLIEGDIVALRCSTRGRNYKPSSSDFTAKFFHNGTFIGEQPDGNMNLSAASTSEGFYECEHPTKGRSARSWLAVRAKVRDKPQPSPDSPLIPVTRVVCSAVLVVLYTVIFIVCVLIYRRWARARADGKKRLSDGL